MRILFGAEVVKFRIYPDSRFKLINIIFDIVLKTAFLEADFSMFICQDKQNI